MKKQLTSFLFIIFLISQCFCDITFEGNMLFVGNIKAGAWTPKDVEGLNIWLDADNDASISFRPSTDYISQWSDLSGNNNHATQGTEATQPSILRNELNGRNVIELDATVSGKLLSLPNYSFPYGDSSYACFFVIKAAEVNTSGVFINSGSQNAGNKRFYLWFIGNSFGHDWYGSNLVGDIVSPNTWYICYADYDGTTRKNILNGGTIYSDVPGVAHENNGVLNYIRNNGDYNYFAELIVYDRALSDSEREQVEDYLTNKWGI